MKNLTFDHIYTIGEQVAETDLYTHFHYPEMLIRYDSNFIQFKKMPNLQEFQQTAHYLRKFHQERGQKHVKFYFPENEKLPSELKEYLQKEKYDIGFMELYAIQPDQFPKTNANPKIEVQLVTNQNFNTYLELQYEQDREYGKAFADQKITLHQKSFDSNHIHQVIAFYKGEPAGSVDVIVGEETAEIDSLYVKETFRNNGIARHIQQFVMNTFSDKTSILLADGDDTPREMYRKQNYEFQGYKYEATKVYE
ncbi:GNAT family N-acetyltransferase [Bacillus carboniphilus]|uniref:GNAT family N-acetyltransferase n=1 Tax=Bacillus carboniphilus TaxID=86663 RepID=A0ABN0WNB9_9BACI